MIDMIRQEEQPHSEPEGANRQRCGKTIPWETWPDRKGNHNGRRNREDVLQSKLPCVIGYIHACCRWESLNQSGVESKRDNGSDHRAGTIVLQAKKTARKPGFACITLLCRVCYRRFIRPIVI